MEISELEQLVDLVRGANVGELTLKQGTERITIKKSAPEYYDGAEYDDEANCSTEYISDDELFNEESVDAGPTNLIVTAPLVGVFGHVKPVAGLNATVVQDQVIGVIEAMKIITEIKSPAPGVIVDLFIEDSHPVEYGQPLFEIAPS